MTMLHAQSHSADLQKRPACVPGEGARTTTGFASTISSQRTQHCSTTSCSGDQTSTCSFTPNSYYKCGRKTNCPFLREGQKFTDFFKEDGASWHLQQTSKKAPWIVSQPLACRTTGRGVKGCSGSVELVRGGGGGSVETAGTCAGSVMAPTSTMLRRPDEGGSHSCTSLYTCARARNTSLMPRAQPKDTRRVQNMCRLPHL